MRFRDHDKLLRHSLLLVLASQVGNVAHLFFQIVMMRRLAPAEYGALMALIGLMAIVTNPLDALRVTMAHYSTRFLREGQASQIRPLLARWMMALAGAGALFFCLSVFLRAPLAAYLQLPQEILLPAAGLVVALNLFLNPLWGVLQGAQRFGWFALSSQACGVFRLAIGAALVLGVSATALSGLGGQLAGVTSGLVLGLIGLSRLGHSSTEASVERERTRYYTAQTLVILLAFAVLVNADTALVKRFFSPEEAGVYARASTLARALVFLTMPIAGAMFPKVVLRGPSTPASRRTLGRAIGLVLLVIAGCVGPVTLLLPWIWTLFTGEVIQPDVLRLARCVIWALSPLSLTYLLLNYDMAQNRFRAGFILVPLACAYVAGAAVWHQAIWQVVAMLGGASVLSLAAMLVGFWRHLRCAAESAA